MKESEFIAILSHELGDTAGWEDIVRDYCSHFEEGRAAGRSEDEIAASLGEPASIAREFKSSGKIGVKAPMLGAAEEAREARLDKASEAIGTQIGRAHV